MPVVIPPAAIAGLESLVLDGLELNDGTTLVLEYLDVTPPTELEEWVRGADSDGALLSREPMVDNRVIEARVRVSPQVTMTAALAKVGLIVDKLKECQRQANGLALVWTPATSSVQGITFRCLSGQITGLPTDVESGYFVYAPLLTVKMSCLPFGLGTESLVSSVTSGAPIITTEVSGVAGDVPALGRLVVTDAASQSRRYVAWGLESRFYPTASPPSLIVDSASMVTAGYAGSVGTVVGAYSGATSNVITTTVRLQPQAICGLGNLSHVGQFRAFLRFHTLQASVALRFVYQALDNPARALSYKIPAAVGFNCLDMGLFTVPPAPAGTQRWTGRIEVYSTAVGGETVSIDALLLMPAERFGRARSTPGYSPGTLATYDDFATAINGSVLNARTAAIGGTWATSGAATDFTANAGSMTRTTTTDGTAYRVAVLGSAVAATEAHITFASTAPYNSTSGLIARWVDASNYLRVLVYVSGPIQGANFAGTTIEVQKVIAGTASTVAYWQAPALFPEILPNTNYKLHLIVQPSGTGQVMYTDSANATLLQRTFFDAVLATGGTLASGSAGFLDRGGAASTRIYDDFYSMNPALEQITCYSLQTIEFRDNATLREDATGVYYGAPPEYVGSRFYVPNAGGPGRKARVAVIARRNDIDTSLDDNLTGNATTDSTTVQVYTTPRYLVVPR